MACVGAVPACGDAAEGPAEELRSISVRFAARVGDEPFSCTGSYEVGSPAVSVQPKDFRLYVYDAALVREGGERVPIAVTDDGTWQGQGVTLLDFDEPEGSCTYATEGTHDRIEGQVPEHDDYVGLSLRIGVPTALNHLQGGGAPPLDAKGLFWSWQDGHVLLRVKWVTPTSPDWELSLGEAVSGEDGCVQDGAAEGGYSCPDSFQPKVELPLFDVARDQVKLDLAALFAHVDLTRTEYDGRDTQPSPDVEANAELDYTPGCHTERWDAECIALLAPLGIDYLRRSLPDPSQQTFATKL